MSALVVLAGLAALSCLFGIYLFGRTARDYVRANRPGPAIVASILCFGQVVASFVFVMMVAAPLSI